MNKRNLNRQLILNAFGNECMICGYNKCSAALEFHHRNPKQKELEISKFAGNNKLNYKQVRELEKCILICCRCHREAHMGLLDEEIDNLEEVELIESIWG